MSAVTIADPESPKSADKPVLSLVFRDRRAGRHSMERLFASIEPFLEREFSVRRLILPYRPGSFWRLMGNVLFARRHRKGIMHITGDAHYVAAFVGGHSTVLTVHDCGRLMDLNGLKKWIYRIFWFELPCRKVKRITVVSKSTKEVFEREIRPMEDRLRVIENCLLPGFERTRRRFNADRPRILQIGSGPHKNLDGLIRSVMGIDCELFIVGKIGVEDRRLMEEESMQYRNEFGVSDQRLREVYGECDLLFFASRHEGFGLPILEAQKVGIPVITSRRYSMPDVAGGGAILVDPENHEEIREAILKLRDDPALREELVEKGFGNIEKYSPQSVAEEYIRLYKELLGN